MNVEEQPQKRHCADWQGRQPYCAPLANPYVPEQEPGFRRYSRGDALSQGTLFPGLNLPFWAAQEGRAVPQTPLTELQALCFVVSELGLYLDTHPEDREAFALFQEFARMKREGQEKYEAMYGPLTQSAAAADSSYTWVNAPWPWACEGGE